jgi:hypothetical protein
MKKIMKKRVKRFEGGGSAEDEFGPISPTGSGRSSDGADIYAAARKRDEDKANSDAYEAKIQELSKDSGSESSGFYSPRLNLSNRPDLSDQYTIAPSPAKTVAKKVDIEKVKAAKKAASAKDQLAAAATPSARQSDNLAVQARADAALRRRIAQTKAQEAGGMESHPELYLNPGRIGTRGIMEAAQALARGKGAARSVAERVEPYMESAAPYLKEIGHSALKLGREFPKLGMKRGGAVKKMSSGGSTFKSTSASSRGDGIASRGKTRGKIC